MRASFITLACYDWRLLPASIAQYHDVADEVLVGLDADRLTWSGTAFDCDRAALNAALAPFPKVKIMEGHYYDPSRRPIDNDCDERRALALQARNEWVVEVDADEIVDGAAILSALEYCPPDRQLYGYWRDILKIDGDTAVVRDTSSGGKLCALATQSRRRQFARQTPQTPYVVDIEVEHLTTARPEAELIAKLAGWGHSDTIRPDFLDYWRGLNPGSPGTISVPVSSLRWSPYLGNLSHG